MSRVRTCSLNIASFSSLHLRVWRRSQQLKASSMSPLATALGHSPAEGSRTSSSMSYTRGQREQQWQQITGQGGSWIRTGEGRGGEGKRRGGERGEGGGKGRGGGGGKGRGGGGEGEGRGEERRGEERIGGEGRGEERRGGEGRGEERRGGERRGGGGGGEWEGRGEERGGKSRGSPATTRHGPQAVRVRVLGPWHPIPLPDNQIRAASAPVYAPPWRLSRCPWLAEL